MFLETAVVLDRRRTPIYWHLPAGRSAVHIPDTRELWDVLWESRTIVSGIAHSHPGVGIPTPSWEDLTTFDAIEAAFGKRLDWWIASSNVLIYLRWTGPSPFDYASFLVALTQPGPSFVDRLRSLSQNRPSERQLSNDST